MPDPVNPRLTVFIPVYNRAHLIDRAINSVLTQSFADFELLIIDDGSTDGSSDVIARNPDPRIRLLRNPENRGIPRTRQRGLEEARGEYFALLDSDDWMRRDRLARQVSFLDARPDIASVGGSVQKFYSDGRKAGLLTRPPHPDEIRVWLLFRNAHANTTLMGRADIMRRFGYRTEFPVSEDFDLAARMAEHHRAANLPSILTNMLQHDGRTTAGSEDRSRTIKIAIMRDQLSALGIDPCSESLERHYRLSRLKAADLARWPDYAEWADSWLDQLMAKNAKAQIYDDSAMRSVLGLVWAQCCLRMAKRCGLKACIAPLLRHGRALPALRIIPDQLRARIGAVVR